MQLKSAQMEKKSLQTLKNQNQNRMRLIIHKDEIEQIN